VLSNEFGRRIRARGFRFIELSVNLCGITRKGWVGLRQQFPAISEASTKEVY